MKLGNYRLALDVGTNSLGWALIRLDDKDTPAGIIRLGSRIFSDGRHPKSGESLGALRRQPRQMRRMRDRTLRRQIGKCAQTTTAEFYEKYAKASVTDWEMRSNDNSVAIRPRSFRNPAPQQKHR